MPETVKRGFGSLAAAVKLPAGNTDPVELDVPLPDIEISLLEIQPFYLRPDDTLVLDSAELVIDGDDEYDHIQITKRSANTVELEVRDLPGYRILSFIDFDYPGWHAYVDGAEVPLLRAFSYFKAVELPPGTHRVRFEYRSPRVYVGIAFSLAALMATLAALVWASRGQRPKAGGVR